MERGKKQTTIIIICCILIVALIALILWRMYVKKQKEELKSSDSMFPLKEGCLGDEIFQLQNGLNAKLRRMTLADEVNLQELKLDGIFGKKTRQTCLLVLGTETVSKEQFDSLVNDL